MIVIGNGVVLSNPTTGVNANNPVVGWHNVVTPDSITADIQEAAHPAANLANPSTYLQWRGTGTVVHTLTFDLSGLEDFDYVAIGGHNFGSARIPVLIEGATALDGFGDPIYSTLAGPAMPAEDTAMLFRYVPAGLIRLRITLGVGTTAPVASVVYIGSALVLSRRIYVGHRPITLNNQYETLNGLSGKGHFLGRVIMSENALSSLDLQNIPAAFYRTKMKPWVQRAKSNPFFWAWRPSAYPEEVGYCWLPANASPQVTNQRSNGMVQVSMPLEGTAPNV